jgi:FKBP-type peptidyl-prolyl cis-trans isomerase
MRVGGVRSIREPSNLTYHERMTNREIPEDAMLIYKLRLVDLLEKWDAEIESRLSNRVGN